MMPHEIARMQLGKPWKHQARGPDFWDCVGLISLSYAQHGIKDRTDYERNPHDGQLEKLVADQFGRPVNGPLRLSDVVLMAFPDKRKSFVRHVGIIGDYQGAGGGLSLIHTWNGGPGRVIETVIDHRWLNRIRVIHRLDLTI